MIPIAGFRVFRGCFRFHWRSVGRSGGSRHDHIRGIHRGCRAVNEWRESVRAKFAGVLAGKCSDRHTIFKADVDGGRVNFKLIEISC